jgi:DNA-binding NtrC family response regulator
MTSAPTILLVDDEEYVRESLRAVLEGEGWSVLEAGDATAGAETLRGEHVDAVVTDLSMPGGGGMALLADAQRGDVQVPIVVLTGVGTVSDAVDAMKAGAFDFLLKPVEPEQLVRLLRHALDQRSLATEVARLRRTVESAAPDLVGTSPELAAVRDAVARAAPSDATVLVTGESGTGKELVARAVHRASARSGAALVTVNCAAVPETLFESEFFGHRKGSFSGAIGDRAGRFEEADGGTLVLDEIGTLKPEMQAKLLRVLEDGEYQVVGESRTRTVDVRVVAVTNEALAQRVEEGGFRADLYYRLNVFPIEVPPLRERKQDIADIAAHLLQRLAPGRPAELDPDALAILSTYDWPGNVRELRNVLERAVLLAGDAPVAPELLASLLESSPGRLTADSPAKLHLRQVLDNTERELLIKALQAAGGSKKEASELLGIDARNISYYLRKHELTNLF